MAAMVVACIIFAAARRLIYENVRVLMDTTPVDARVQVEAAISGLGDAIELRRGLFAASASRAHLHSLTAVDVPCSEAHELALHVAREGSGPADWSFTPTISVRYVSWACLNRHIVSPKVNFTYYVK